MKSSNELIDDLINRMAKKGYKATREEIQMVTKLLEDDIFGNKTNVCPTCGYNENSRTYKHCKLCNNEL